MLEKEHFDLLFFTHQRPPFIALLAYQASQLKIKTALDYLADNLVFAPKRALQTPQREWLSEDLKEFEAMGY